MTTRKRKDELTYLQHRATAPSGVCIFCQFTPETERVIEDHSFFWVVRNYYGYTIWDNLDVQEHLMLVPKKHTESIADLPLKAQHEYGTILAAYETKGYSIYARASTNISKSVPHQHTHLLKLGAKPKVFNLFLRKPYILWSK